jgi:hypothetical protein
MNIAFTEVVFTVFLTRGTLGHGCSQVKDTTLMKGAEKVWASSEGCKTCLSVTVQSCTSAPRKRLTSTP